jgi:two-component system, cell cycle sensor histidine kinase and response regulator CckA
MTIEAKPTAPYGSTGALPPHSWAFGELFSRISTLAVDLDDPTRLQAESVAALGQAASASRAYIFEHRHDPDRMDIAHEWCAPGVLSRPEGFRSVPADAVSWLLDTLQGGGVVSAMDMGEIPHRGSREFLMSKGTLSVLVVPVVVEGRPLGFMGLEDHWRRRRWTEAEVTSLRAVSRIMAGVLERRATEDRLEAQRSQLLSILDSITEPIYVADPYTYEVLFTNEAVRELLGKDPSGGLCHRELHGLESPCPFCTNEIILARRDETYRWEHRNVARGRTYAVRDRIIRWPDGRDVRLELAVDITQQKRLEEQLHAMQKLEAVGRLAGGVARDFSNSLSVILNCAAFLLEGLPPGDPLRADVEEIRTCGDRAVTLTRQLLAFSQKQFMEPRVVDLNEMVTSAEPMLRSLLREDIELVMALAPDLGLVKADPRQLEQVIRSLVLNARDAMPGGGRLTIETANAELNAEHAQERVVVSPGRYVLLAIGDSGVGMDEVTRQRLFEPFFTTKELGKGTGLGLSSVYGIVKQCEGNIWAYSEAGQGSTFKVYLPLLTGEAPPETAAPPPEDSAPSGETILLVEDDETVRRITSRILHRLGYQVLPAESGEEALRVCQQHPGEIHLLLTDVVLPRMSGLLLAKRASALRPELAVLYTSGYSPKAMVHQRVLEPGMSFVGKPFGMEELKEAVRQALRRRSPAA